ncbi:unnamed protein product [Prunus armeniaca]
MGDKGDNLVRILNKGKGVFGEKRDSHGGSMNDQLDDWVGGQILPKDKGVYIFGHQLPNIANENDKRVEEMVPDVDNVSLASAMTDGCYPMEGMNLSEGQVHTEGETDANHTSKSAGGMTVALDLWVNSPSSYLLFVCEPGISGSKDLKVIKFLGFSGFEVLDPIGFSGGIPCYAKREKLWEYLDFMASCYKMLWLLAGDFNEMLNVDDKLKHEQFQNFVIPKWEQGVGSALHKSWGLVEPLKQWNLTVFGHLNQRKVKRLARLNGIQRVLYHMPIRVKWLQEGDRNTKFFHLTTIVRRRRIRIEKLKNDNDMWVEEAEGLKELAVNYFFGLFAMTLRDHSGLSMPNLFPSINDVDLNGLVVRVDISEVKKSLFNLGGLKAPGVDEFPTCFYQNQWNMCGNDIYDMVVQAFRERHIVKGLHASLIQLIMECVSSVTYQLSQLIVEAVGKHIWKRVKASQAGHCLDIFCKASSQIVNFEKYAIYCSLNISKEVATNISCIYSSRLTKNLGKYLGMPLLHSRVTKVTYSSLVDKVHARLASWKSNILFYAGRATLFQAVTLAIPVYAMQTSKLPRSICEDLDKVNRNFFWGGSEKKHKIHLCQWDLVCKPKSKGGLGLKKTHDMNQALLAKVGWRLLRKDEGLWAQIFEKKYIKRHSFCEPNMVPKQNYSPTWKGTMFGAQLLDKRLIWRLGKGDKVKFWRDKWISDVPLMQTVDLAHDLNSNSLVSDFFVNGWWDVEKLRSVLPEEWVQKVIGCSTDFQGILEDCQIWKPTSNGFFSVKSAYSLLFQGANWLNPWWRALWKLRIPPKLQIFFWLVFQEKILSNEQRVRRHLVGNCACDYYKWSIESTLHILRDCSRARKAIVGINSGTNKVQVLLACVLPEIGVVKLNIDGSRRVSTGAIGAKGVLRDHLGQWIGGFAVNLGQGEVLEAELWGLFFGLNLAVEKKVVIVIEMDSDTVVLLI